MKRKMRIVTRLLILLSILLVTLAVMKSPVFAQVGGRERAAKVFERKLVRLKRIKRETQIKQAEFRTAFDIFMEGLGGLYKSLDTLIQDQMDDLCSLGKKEFCPVEPIIPKVSSGNTKLITFDVRVTNYNPRRSQTDASPCEGWAGNVCYAYEQGLNPVAASQDIAVYPLGRKSKIMLKSKSLRNECKALEGKIYTVMDTLSSCLRKNRDLRTGRCNTPITQQIDVFVPCADSDCFNGVAKAVSFGVCQATLVKL